MSECPISRVEAEELIGASKDARLAAGRWHTVTHPGTAAPLRKDLSLTVETRPPPSAGVLLVRGRWMTERQIQLFLILADAEREWNLARLCLTPTHGKDLHWHFHEGSKGETVREDVSQPPATIDEQTMFNDIFVPTLRITNLTQVLP